MARRGPILIHRGRLQAMSAEALQKACADLSREWLRAGYPDESDMPRWMLVLYLALQQERERRGDQLSLF